MRALGALPEGEEEETAQRKKLGFDAITTGPQPIPQ